MTPKPSQEKPLKVVGELELDVEITAVGLERDAKYLACAPQHLLRKNRAEIEAARESLNDALAKIDRRIAA